MVHASLFSGIGGFDYAADLMGWENLFHCEWNPFGQRVLKYYWPNSISYHDITKTDFTIHRGTVDVLTGGFPCQPFSTSGKQKGTEDERYLWPEMLRAILEIQPLFIVGENVSGLVNWSKGLVFEKVQADLEAAGYEVIPFVLPAAGIGAPHRRDRVWFICRIISDTSSNGRHRNKEFKKGCDSVSNRFPFNESISLPGSKFITNSSGERLKKRIQTGERIFQEKAITQSGSQSSRGNTAPGWEEFPTKSPICDGNDGFSDRLDGIAFSKWRAESVKAGGNAIVPGIALQIFKAIEQYEILLKTP